MMTVPEAQREVREVFVNGSVGQAVSGVLWLAAAAVGVSGGRGRAVLVLVLGGVLIFPATQLVLRVAGRRYALSRENPLNGLAMQVAFVLPLSIPVALGAALHRIHWFFPAMMVLVGAHYLPFVFLYGMRAYAVLAGALVAGGLGLALYGPATFALGGVATGVVLVSFAAWAGLGLREAA